MDGVTLGVIGLRAAALALLLSGRTAEANKLYALADLVEAGQASDEHMKLVAEKLKSRSLTDADWQDVMDRIAADSARLQGA